MNYITKIFSTKNIEAIGRKKSSIVKTIIFPGYGNVYINKSNFNFYFIYNNLSKFYYVVNFLFLVLKKKLYQYDLLITCLGGGVLSQIRAILITISKILAYQDNYNKQILKFFSCLQLDTKIKERRKFGLKKARKAEQYHKR